MKNKFKELLPYIIIIISVVVIRTFIVTPVRVDGESMSPALENNDILVLNKMNHTYQRFDIVVIRYNGVRLVKRIIGLPGEMIVYKNNKLYVNGKYIKEEFLSASTDDFTIQYLGENKVPADSYFVMGDNRGNSMDSRMIGFISSKDILGKTKFTLFPLHKFGKIE